MNEPVLKVIEVIDILPSGNNSRRKERRAGLFLAFLLSILVLGFVLGWVILRFALPEPRYHLVGTLADFLAANEPYQLHVERRFFVVNTGKDLIALSDKSPHQVFWHCPIYWSRADGTFMEPCGGSQFRLDGSYLLGPSPRAMYRHPVRIEGDRVWVDPARLIEGEKVR